MLCTHEVIGSTPIISIPSLPNSVWEGGESSGGGGGGEAP